MNVKENGRPPPRLCVAVAAVLLLVSILPGCCPAQMIDGDPLAKTGFRPLEGEARQFEPALRAFFAAKERQARALAAHDSKQIHPDVWRCFGAAARGDWRAVHRHFWRMAPASYALAQEEHKLDDRMATPVWQTVNETFRAYEKFSFCPPKFLLLFAGEVTNSIPAGSIYLGGSDPGRFLITFLSRSQIDGDPFFTLSQSQLADGLYCDYVEKMYGAKIHVPTHREVQKAFEEYLAQAMDRLKQEGNRPLEDGKAVVGPARATGGVAVRAISSTILKTIVEENPDREFLLEVGLILDWTYPRLVPHGFIFELRRKPVETLGAEVLRRDRDFWTRQTDRLIGDWLKPDTGLTNAVQFAERIYLRQNLNGFRGEADYVRQSRKWRRLPPHVDVCEMFAAWRAAVGNVYAWRAQHVGSAEERQRMGAEADFAFRQALALCPYSDLAIEQYLPLLAAQQRFAEILLLVDSPVVNLGASPGLRERLTAWRHWVASQGR